jgi:hypothetical protein
LPPPLFYAGPQQGQGLGEKERRRIMAELKDLIGKTMKAVENQDGEEVIFTTEDDRKYHMYHSQDCCESVRVEDICGDLQDLVGSPILKAEESSSDKNPPGVTPEYQDSFTWTFYNLATAKGHVTIRWYGESNGYYSESVYFEEIT